MARTKPELWNQIVEKYKKSSKGGDKREWSARKAQLAVQEYKERGGGYTGTKTEEAKSLSKWTKQNWKYSSKEMEKKGGRYLPRAVWNELNAEQKRITNKNKIEGKGDVPYEQFVINAFKKAGVSMK
jgi:hypothetical protein